MWDKLDETSPDDDTTFSFAPGNADTTVEVGLSTVSDPGVSNGHIVRSRQRKTTTRAGELTVSLIQGTTVIASSTPAMIATTYATVTITLTGTEADSITDYSDLRIRTFWDDTGGGQPGENRWTWAELEVPDAAVGPHERTGSSSLAVSTSATGVRTATATATASVAVTTTGAGEATGVPAAPANPAALALSSSSIQVTWDDVANETGYRIERRLCV